MAKKRATLSNEVIKRETLKNKFIFFMFFVPSCYISSIQFLFVWTRVQTGFST